MRSFYFGIDELWDSQCDGLIVTGREPTAPNLNEEPYWGSLTEVVDWAENNSVTTIWSCLAAHAAVLHLDGVHRHSLVAKRFGVFEYEKMADHPLLQGVAGPVLIPHSHVNEVRKEDLAAFGYTVLTRSANAGVDAFVREGKGLSIFFQGHPEYGAANTLVEEYRRDIARFLKREWASYPTMPQGLFAANAERICYPTGTGHSPIDTRISLPCSPSGLVPETGAEPWRSTSTQIYRNWLLSISARRKARQMGVRSATSGRSTVSGRSSAKLRGSQP